MRLFRSSESKKPPMGTPRDDPAKQILGDIKISSVDNIQEKPNIWQSVCFLYFPSSIKSFIAGSL